MLTFRQVTLSRGNKLLLEQANVTLYEKQKIGLVGHNGCGKSSLFSLILGNLVTDLGDCLINPSLSIGHLSQQLPDSSEAAIDFVLAGDTEHLLLQRHLVQAEESGDHEKVATCHERMNQTGGYSKPAKAASIMAGLGFSAESQNQPVNSFSGGWRMRLSLARCLMNPADLLLLDEPTNHLDMEAILWLEKWLKQTPSSILVISHDREFLDAFVAHVLHIEKQSLNLYSGNYSNFEQTRAQQLTLQQVLYERQQQKIAHMMAYVNRFRAKATKAKQAQGRVKAISRMDIIAQAQIDSPFSFDFYPCPRASSSLIRSEQVNAGYQPDKPILKKINLVLNAGDRIALLGRNGEGKSTLIKTLIGTLNPLAGTIYRSPHLQIGYYAQHQLEELDDELSPIETIQALSPDAREQTIRDYLGGFHFIGDMAAHSIHHFSGGEKARLALAKLVWLKPNLLLLDEPTNHLDLEMRAAIEIALQSYEGALILISHDRHLLRTTVDDFYLVHQQQVHPFKGDLDDYYQWLTTKEPSKESSQASNSNQHREKKTLQNRLKKLEQLVESLHHRLSELELTLSDLSLYEASQAQRLKQLLDEQKTVQQTLSQNEEEWLELADSLEHLT